MPDAQGKPTDAELREQIIGALSSDAKAKPSKAEDLEILRDPDGNPLGYRDLSTGAYFPIPAPRAVPAPDITSPAETTWVDIIGPVQQGQTPQQQGYRIVNGQMQAISGLTRAKPASDTSGAPQWIPDPQDATKEIQVVYSGTTAMPVSANGVVVSRPRKIEAPAPGAPTTKTVGGVTYQWNPDTRDWDKTNLPAEPEKPEAPKTEVRNGITYQWDPATRSWSQAAGLPSAKPATQIYGIGQNDEWRITVDDQGNEVSRVRNPNYVQPKPTQLTPDTVAANIPLLKPDGTIDFQPNRNQVTVNQAMSDLLGQVGVKVNAGSMSMADAKDLLTGTVNALNAQTAQTQAQTAQTGEARAAAGDILTATSQGATTGAGMLQNRVTNAQNMVQSALGLAGQGQRSGNLGGGLMTPLPGIGAQLVGGAQAWATELGGGQDVYDTAARLVKAADPNGGGSPMAQAAYGVLTQMLDRYGQQFGPHPAVQATAAARASTQGNGMTAPAAQPTYNPAYASGGLGPVMAGQFTAPQVPQVQPVVQPQAFVAPLATNNLGNTDPRLRGLIY